METAKDILIRAIEDQPDDSTYEEILRELAFHQVILRGLDDSRNDRTISHQDLGDKIKSWGKN